MDASSLRILMLIAIFASIFLVSQVLIGSAVRNRDLSQAINKRLRLIAEGTERDAVIATLRKNEPQRYEGLPLFARNLLNRLRRMLLASGLGITPAQVILGMAILSLVITLLLIFVAQSTQVPLTLGVFEIILAFAVASAIGVPLFLLNFVAQRRRRKMELQFPIALDIFVRALRSGHPIASAIQLLTEEMEDPIGSEFGLASDEVAYGAELDEALSAMAERWDLDDMRMFVVSLVVQSETGGNLAEILENLADVIRARANMFMKVRALSSEGRMTGWILTAVPVLTFVGLFTSSPRFFLDVARDKIFLYGFPILIILYCIGFYVIRRMIDLKV